MKWIGEAAYSPAPNPAVSRAIAGSTLAAVLAIGLILAWHSSAGAAAMPGDPPAFSAAPAQTIGPPPLARTYITPTTYSAFLPLVVDNSYSREPAFGVQVYWADGAARAALSDLGSRWVRMPISWRSIEPENTTPDHYQWPWSLDQQLIALSAQHVRVILLFNDNPTWAATYRNGPIDLAPLGELGEFMQAAAARYGQPPFNIKHWEMYNEPDCGDSSYANIGYGFFGHDPQAYVDLLHTVYDAVKPVDPAIQVVLGGLAYDWFEEDGGPFVRDFIDQVLQLGGDSYFDFMNLHYYRVFDLEWAPYGHGILGKLAVLQEILESNNVDKPFLSTESGWYSDDGGPETEVQARYVVQLFARVQSVDLAPMIWYALVDPTIPEDPKFGLLELDMDRKPSYYAYRTVVDQLSGAQYVRTWTDQETGSQETEAYEYAAAGAGVSIVVAWTNDESIHPLTINAPEVELVDKGGYSWIVYDGDDQNLDGRVTWQLGPSPMFFRFMPDGRLLLRRPGGQALPGTGPMPGYAVR